MAQEKKKAKKSSKSKTAERTIPKVWRTVPLMRDALICIIDDPRAWGRAGRPSAHMHSAAMPQIAEYAADQSTGPLCFFCGHEQTPVAEEEKYRWHPEYALCECLTPHRRMAWDYIEGWEKPEKQAKIRGDVEAGLLGPTAPVYQFCCPCGSEPTVITAGMLAASVKFRGRHIRRRQCEKCFQKYGVTGPRKALKVPVAEIVGPKHGPAATFKKKKKKKTQVKQEEAPVVAPESCQPTEPPGQAVEATPA